MSFFQDPPRLGNQFHEDRVLRSLLARILPGDVQREIEPSLAGMGELAAGRLWELARECRSEEPEHVPYDAWGRGVGTRLARHLADWAIAQGAYRLQGSCMEGNAASRRILEGLGMQLEGRRPGFRLKGGVRHAELLLGVVVGER